MSSLAQLVADARPGGAAAMEELAQRLAPMLHGVALAHAPHHAAGDVVSRCVVELRELVRKGEPATVLAAAVGRARSLAADARRTRGAAEQSSSDPAVTDARLLLARLRALPERERERLAMRLVEGITGPEIAELTGAAEAEVRSDLERAVSGLVLDVQGTVVTAKNDAYLWALAGAPHLAVVPLETRLTALRYDPGTSATATNLAPVDAPGLAPDVTPVMGQSGPRRAPEGKRQTGEVPAQGAARMFSDVESTEPSGGRLVKATDGDFDEATLNGAPLPRLPTAGPNPFEQQPGTIPATDLPAAAQVNPYAAMPATVAATDLPAAAAVKPEGRRPTGEHSVKPEGKRRTGEQPAQGQPAGRRPTGQFQAPPAPSRPPAEPTRAAPPTSAGAVVRSPEAPSPQEAEPTKALGTPLSVLSDGGPQPTRMMPAAPAANWKSLQLDDDEGTLTRAPPPVPRAPPNPWRGSLPFALAGMLATVAVAVGWMTVVSSERQVTRAWNLVPVTVAAHDIPAGTLVTFDMLSSRAVPDQFITASVVKPDSASYVVNQKILVPVQAGDPLLWTQFEMAAATERLSRKVSTRARAWTLEAAQAISVGGWVRPGDRVDVISSIRQPGVEGKLAITLLQDVMVLATGKLSQTTNFSVLEGPAKEYTNVSLLLLPEEVEVLVLAKEIGSYRLTLRNDDDRDVRRDGLSSNSKTLLEGERVRLLQSKRLMTIQTIRGVPVKSETGGPVQNR